MDVVVKIFLYLHRFGGIAQLARAFDWQSRGQGFDSPYLHSKKQVSDLLFCIILAGGWGLVLKASKKKGVPRLRHPLLIMTAKT